MGRSTHFGPEPLAVALPRTVGSWRVILGSLEGVGAGARMAILDETGGALRPRARPDARLSSPAPVDAGDDGAAAEPAVGVIGADLTDATGPVDVVLRLSQPVAGRGRRPERHAASATCPTQAAQQAIIQADRAPAAATCWRPPPTSAPPSWAPCPAR